MQETASRRRSVGRVAPHAEVHIVGPDDVELPRGEVGEIAVAAGKVLKRELRQPYWADQERAVH